MIWGGKVRYLFYTYIVLIKRNIAWLHYIPTCLFAASPLIIYVWLGGRVAMLQTIQTPSPVIISNYSLRPRSGASGEQEFICCFGYFYLSKNISGWCDGARVDEWFVERLTDVACKSNLVLWVWSPCVPVWLQCRLLCVTFDVSTNNLHHFPALLFGSAARLVLSRYLLIYWLRYAR